MKSLRVTLGLLVLRKLTVAVLLHGIGPVHPNMLLQAEPIKDTSLELYKTHDNVEAPGKCAYVCAESSPWDSECRAFVYHASNNTCDFYRNCGSYAKESSLQVFKIQVRSVFFNIPIGGSVYSVFLSDEYKMYDDARVHCRQLGAHLLEFDSHDEKMATLKIAVLEDTWSFLGATDFGEGGDSLVHDRSRRPLDTDVWVWSSWQPTVNADEELCAAFSHAFGEKLYKVSCSSKRRFYCEKDTI